MQPIPYLFFPGTCMEAMRFYAETFGSDTPEIMPFSAAPEDARAGFPASSDDQVMHAALKVGEGWLFASDDPTASEGQMAGVSISLSYPTAEEGRRIFDALSEGGEVGMAYAPTFWSPGFGVLTDRFGIRWMVMADAPGPA